MARKQIAPRTTICTLCALLLVGPTPLQANTTVALLEVQAREAYSTARVYAGRTVARRASELGFNLGGEVAEIAVDIGDSVLSGDLIGKLDTRRLRAALTQARANVQLATANLQAVEAETQLAQQTEQRFRRLRESRHVSEQRYDEQLLALRAKTAHRNVARANLQSAKAAQLAAEIVIQEAHVYAPFNGTIQARYVDEGSQITPGTPIVRLVETTPSEAHIGVPQTVAPTLSTNAKYEILWENELHAARLTAVLPEIDSSSRTVIAIFSIDAAPIPLGAVVELRLRQSVATPGFWVPVTALTESDRGLWGVYVINDQSRVERRIVEIIHSESERAYVRGTLENNDHIVRTGVQRLVPGQQVTRHTAEIPATAAR